MGPAPGHPSTSSLIDRCRCLCQTVPPNQALERAHRPASPIKARAWPAGGGVARPLPVRPSHPAPPVDPRAGRQSGCELAMNHNDGDDNAPRRRTENQSQLKCRCRRFVYHLDHVHFRPCTGPICEPLGGPQTPTVSPHARQASDSIEGSLAGACRRRYLPSGEQSEATNG